MQLNYKHISRAVYASDPPPNLKKIRPVVLLSLTLKGVSIILSQAKNASSTFQVSFQFRNRVIKEEMWHGKSKSRKQYWHEAPSRSSKEHVHDSRNAIPDSFSSVDQVVASLRESGLESSNLILGIDFTKSNEWTGRHSFGRRSLHAIGTTQNPYEQAISIIGRTLSPFDEDNLIPCFGFGDATTRDQYRYIVPHLNLSGPTSFAPVIHAAISIVESSWQYHVLVIIADGQVNGTNGPDGRLSPQEEATIDAIVTASHYPLSIVMVGVGDGPWDAMKHFDDCIPQRAFDNFQFVNFTSIMTSQMHMSKKEAAFALAALMEIPAQYRATQSLYSPEKHRRDRIGAPNILPPPSAVIELDNAANAPRATAITGKSTDDSASTEMSCPICLTNPKDMAFQCGHLTCRECGSTLATCPICRAQITLRIKLYS
ncbi:copine family protein [Rhynchospora pubera]|uniref:Copine family protein n=1 Tax=Rhynchospora pubera TaxID=906938 RepID=A0AAV8G660_9POAL|nr:copine family protein [Rhynchospora pubera]